ncbi:MAG: helix-turn-helix transcriptional regulator [Candidatus Bipolaricaulota bacterium]
MSTKVVKLNQAEQMMTYLEIDKEEMRILVRFADGKEGWVPVNDIEELSPEKSLNLDKVELPNPYELEIGAREGKSIKVPWDFARHYCDTGYKTKEINQRDEGRSVLGNRISSIRKKHGMTQKELAEKADLGRVTVSRLENGEQSPRYQTLENIADALEIDIFRLLIT